MIKGSLFILLLACWYIGMNAQVARPVTISGQIKSDRDSVKLIVWFAKDPIVGFGDEMQRIPVSVQPGGRFSFTTPAISKPARLSIHDAVSRNAVFTLEQQVIMPGDKVEVFVNVHDQGEPYYIRSVFFGKGADKYECIQALNMIKTRALDTARSTKALLYYYDSLLAAKQKLVDQFKSRLTHVEYQLINADMTGELNNQVLTAICGYNFGSFHAPHLQPEALAAKKKIFDELVDHMTGSTDTEIIPQSVTYRQFLYQRSKAELVFENNGEPVQLIQLFRKLSKQYTGLLKEKLLGSLLLNTTENYYFFGGIDPDDHLVCLKEAASLTQNNSLKERINQSLKGLVKGAPAFDFNLPVDSSLNKRVRLSDLKGKVVLLDLWSYQCTGCVQFTNTFHKKIYPAFKDNPNFVVVSIMLGESSRKHYMRRLRSEGGAVYTFPEYINLFGGRGIASARDMEKYHDITGYPTIMLISKQGTIYSSTLPVIYGDPRNKGLQKNIDQLTTLIQKALTEQVPQKPVL